MTWGELKKVVEEKLAEAKVEKPDEVELDIYLIPEEVYSPDFTFFDPVNNVLEVS